MVMVVVVYIPIGGGVERLAAGGRTIPVQFRKRNRYGFTHSSFTQSPQHDSFTGLPFRVEKAPPKPRVYSG